MLIMAGIISVRVWWLKRRLGRQKGAGNSEARDSTESIRVIEGEYREVRRADKDFRDDQS